ncbi:alpha-1,4-glucan--maltose-1-phosphate maltosyltransferase [Siphonobacter sp. SORGH_AS_0500]|uniref:maltotransferase domain-containing protein n=1 Tax=Siphonobacter sp. SORGH_AS_0500 TaxID=1864824 RepID=UPI000CB756FC|nr:maltotransferase domain-containing protein [Siphonobacter sp. SORGH_AS_0500]PKK35826.1 alpha-1,4-glucan--maltose-1-phosphate maltosyltransferase [Siphonobacter sp. SORGH_AS_0500]
MHSLEHWAGQQRVLITRVSPEVDGGRFAVKAIVNDPVSVQVDLLVDGFDLPSGYLLFRHESETEWQRVSLQSLGNDRYEATFYPQQIGLYSYTFEAWVNHFLTWQRNITRHARDFQPVEDELKIGIHYLKRILAQASPEDHYLIQEAIGLFQNPDRHQEAVTKALSQQMTQWIENYPLIDHVSTYAQPFPLSVSREKAVFSTWYSLFPRSTSTDPLKSGTFQTTIEVLPRIASMGFDVLHLPPIHPIGRHFRRGKNDTAPAQSTDPGVPYAVGNEQGGHDSIALELGTLADFKALIRAAQQQGIEIAMDLAIQCSPDHPWVKQHPDWFIALDNGTFQTAENPPHKYEDSYCLNFETDDWQNLWKAIRDLVFQWAEWGVRIIRADQPHGKPFAFWEWLITETKQTHPDLIYLAEAFTSPAKMQELSKLGFDQSYTYFIWRNHKSELTDYLKELTETNVRHYLRPNFWPNTHDINPYSLQTGLEPIFLTRYFLAATLSSNCGIFGPSFEHMVHEAYPGREEYLNSEKYAIRHWDWTLENKLTLFIRLLNRIRRENSALQRTNNLSFVPITNDALLAYLKTHPNGNRILCVVNLDPHHRQSAGIQVPLSLIGKQADQPFTVHDLLTDNRWQWQGEWNYIELDPTILPMHLFRIED